jgi:hypothetical protein
VVVLKPAAHALARPQISIIDGRKFESEGDGEEAVERCELLANKQGQPLLAHGRSGSYTDTKRVMVPMIHGQALLPDLKITDSSEALLTGRAPPFRLACRAVHRSGEPFAGVRFALSEPFVVATARVKGAAKLEIPHVDDHVSKIDCVGLQASRGRGRPRAAVCCLCKCLGWRWHTRPLRLYALWVGRQKQSASCEGFVEASPHWDLLLVAKGFGIHPCIACKCSKH